jgi:hypothetical protein
MSFIIKFTHRSQFFNNVLFLFIFFYYDTTKQYSVEQI